MGILYFSTKENSGGGWPQSTLYQLLLKRRKPTRRARLLLRKRIAHFLALVALINAPICASQHSQSTAIMPIPAPPIMAPEKVSLGKRLYNEGLFSKNNSLSCNSCHIVKHGGVDNLPKYIGMNKVVGLYNTPTVLNASLNFRQFWNGRSKSLEDVIDDHLKDPTIFANTWENVIQKIKENPEILKALNDAYPQGISVDTIKDALVTYQNSLLTPDSAFDLFLKGNKSSLSEDAQKGYQLFKSYGCITCHQGPGVGGNLYQKLGIYSDYFATKTNITKADLGLYNLTGKEEDKYVFKVPSLRNVTLTGPYLHDGSAATLEEVIALMGIYQVGQPVQPFDIPYIIKFLQSLSGKLPNDEK